MKNLNFFAILVPLRQLSVCLTKCKSLVKMRTERSAHRIEPCTFQSQFAISPFPSLFRPANDEHRLVHSRKQI